MDLNGIKLNLIAWINQLSDADVIGFVFRNAGYQGYFSVEVPAPKNEYDIVSTALSKIRTVMHKWDLENN